MSTYALKKLAQNLFTSSNDLFTNKRKLTIVNDFVYKPILGDEVDRMFALTLAKLGY
jgi:hypothetical protein